MSSVKIFLMYSQIIIENSNFNIPILSANKECDFYKNNSDLVILIDNIIIVYPK